MSKTQRKRFTTLQTATRGQSVPYWEAALFALAATLVYAYFASSLGNLLHPSRFSYFNYLAKALLSGHLHLVESPPGALDLSTFGGRLYLYWPPFPAVVLMPFVAIWGVGVSDVLVTVVLGGVNVFLVARLLVALDEEGLTSLGDARRRLLVLTFALGSVHLTVASFGRVWFTAQVIGFACVCLTFLAALKLRGHAAFLLTGVALACALATRNHLVFCGLWPAYFLGRRHLEEVKAPRRAIALGVSFLLPIVCAIGLLALYNLARFGSVLETGISYHALNDFFRAEYERYGAFSLHYLPRNFFWQYLAYPFPLTERSLMGGSLFLLTPMFLAAFWASRKTSPVLQRLFLVASVVLTAIPILLLMGTGWKQVGPRYTLDFTVPLLVLVALGLQRWPLWLIWLAALVGIAHFFLGTAFIPPFIT